VDYHRFHFPDNGVVESVHWVAGDLYSVNPIVFDDFPEVFLRNERCVVILKTENFGRIAYVPVGATAVGKIVMHHRAGQSFRRGDEAGYFLFGGSTVVMLGEKGRWVPEPEISDRTLNIQRETYLKLGQVLGSAR
jgi:phosphatidylserine decarboxylase